MPGRPDFRLYHSNALDVLAGLLAEELRTSVPGQALLAPDVVLIPQVAMRRWLQAALAQAHGIAANLEFLTPGEFVQRALDANVAGQGEDLDADGLRWRLYAALSDPALLREPALRPLRAYLHGDGRNAEGSGTDDAFKAWSLAGELASVFEKYQAWRRDWLLGWEAGHVGVERALHELARGQELKVRRDAVCLRQRRLQPTPHRHLRDQHDVGRQQRLPRYRRAQFLGEQSGQHVQRIGVVETEVGAAGHGAILPQWCRRGRDCAH